jgi:hypothetical protein
MWKYWGRRGIVRQEIDKQEEASWRCRSCRRCRDVPSAAAASDVQGTLRHTGAYCTLKERQ